MDKLATAATLFLATVSCGSSSPQGFENPGGAERVAT
jgi:hypothetical protein